MDEDERIKIAENKIGYFVFQLISMKAKSPEDRNTI